MKKKNAPTKPTTTDNPKASAELRCSALLDGSLVSVYAKAKKQTKPLFSFRHPQLEKEMWKYQNDMTCTLLYGCSMKELPPDLRRTVERVLNARHRQHKKGENALLRVGSELSKRAKPSNNKLTHGCP